MNIGLTLKNLINLALFQAEATDISCKVFLFGSRLHKEFTEDVDLLFVYNQTNVEDTYRVINFCKILRKNKTIKIDIIALTSKEESQIQFAKNESAHLIYIN